jgi:inositol phosphorylceramide mannosyltransferase catalytic subunit
MSDLSAALATLPPANPATVGIPKTIYQVFPSKNLPLAIKNNIQHLQQLNPTWQHHLFDDADMETFIREEYDEALLAYFYRINPNYGPARADLFRYLLLYKKGGVYLDIKSSLQQPLDSVLKDDDAYVLSKWDNGADKVFAGWGIHKELAALGGAEFQQWHLIAAPLHPFLKAVIQQVLRNIDSYNPLTTGIGKRGVLRTTGPIAYTQSIAALQGTHAHRLVDGALTLGLMYSIYPTPRGHTHLFCKHYTQLLEPVILSAGLSGKVWQLLNVIRVRLAQAKYALPTLHRR